jgi:methylmalonyl-CoA/ethylmalonyl-CoA epimerase
MAGIKKIHHVAVVVADIDEALSFWRDRLGLTLSEVRDVPAQKTSVAFLPAGESQIELVRPATDDSGVARYLTRYGPGMHHVCLVTDDLDGLLQQLKSRGVRLVNEVPLVNADGHKYAFVHPDSASGVLLELTEE